MIGGQGQDLRAANTADAPDKVAPREGKGLSIDGDRLVGALPPLSYHVVRLKKA
jgi:alpha-N-arabinofuranosidase